MDSIFRSLEEIDPDEQKFAYFDQNALMNSGGGKPKEESASKQTAKVPYSFSCLFFILVETQIESRATKTAESGQIRNEIDNKFLCKEAKGLSTI